MARARTYPYRIESGDTVYVVVVTDHFVPTFAKPRVYRIRYKSRETAEMVARVTLEGNEGDWRRYEAHIEEEVAP